MTDSEYQLAVERDELRRQVASLRKERERWRQLPTPLTDAEREAVEWAAVTAGGWYEHQHAATLRGLLERCAIGHQE